MPKRSKRAKVNDDPIILVDNPMKAKHAKPPVEEHGLCLANPCRVLVVREDWTSPMTTGALSRWILWKKETLRDSILDYTQRFDITLER